MPPVTALRQPLLRLRGGGHVCLQIQRGIPYHQHSHSLPATARLRDVVVSLYADFPLPFPRHDAVHMRNLRTTSAPLTAIRNFTKVVAAGYAEDGIRVNSTQGTL